MTTIGRKSAISRAATQTPDPVWSQTWSTSATAARYVPKLEPAVARKRYPNAGERRREVETAVSSPRPEVTLPLGPDFDYGHSSRVLRRTCAEGSGGSGHVPAAAQAPRIAFCARVATSPVSLGPLLPEAVARARST